MLKGWLMKSKPKNTILFEQILNAMGKSLKEVKSISLTHKYIAAHFSSWVQTLIKNVGIKLVFP